VEFIESNKRRDININDGAWCIELVMREPHVRLERNDQQLEEPGAHLSSALAMPSLPATDMPGGGGGTVPILDGAAGCFRLLRQV
jgi:hypothetical protein